MPSFIPDKPATWLLYGIIAALLLGLAIAQIIRRRSADANAKKRMRASTVLSFIAAAAAVGMLILASTSLLVTRSWGNAVNLLLGLLCLTGLCVVIVILVFKGGRFTGRLPILLTAAITVLLALAAFASHQMNLGRDYQDAVLWVTVYNVCITIAEIGLWVLAFAIVFALVWAGVAKLVARRRAARATTTPAAAPVSPAPAAPTTPAPTASPATGRTRPARRRTPGTP